MDGWALPEFCKSDYLPTELSLSWLTPNPGLHEDNDHTAWSPISQSLVLLSSCSSGLFVLVAELDALAAFGGVVILKQTDNTKCCQYHDGSRLGKVTCIKINFHKNLLAYDATTFSLISTKRDISLR